MYDREVCCLHIVERVDTNFGLTYWLQGVLETLWPAERFPSNTEFLGKKDKAFNLSDLSLQY